MLHNLQLGQHLFQTEIKLRMISVDVMQMLQLECTNVMHLHACTVNTVMVSRVAKERY